MFELREVQETKRCPLCKTKLRPSYGYPIRSESACRFDWGSECPRHGVVEATVSINGPTKTYRTYALDKRELEEGIGDIWTRYLTDGFPDAAQLEEWRESAKRIKKHEEMSNEELYAEFLGTLPKEAASLIKLTTE